MSSGYSVLDADDKVLLLKTTESTDPIVGTVWELPGGGIEAGGGWADAAGRELHDETGLTTDATHLSEPAWQRTATYRYRGHRRLQHERVVMVRLPERQPQVSGRNRTDDERNDCIGSRWWPIEEIVNSSERFYPGRLPSLLPRVLSGQPVTEPFERWP
ncbi:NUDIX domain-containing protein [Actinopolymorpha sp. B11F2]|uniref:NUDIX domain-containing protein n=1 Tax=Actinopolymorpha sp. B11F2 TaxID=3160862 RepID=UPI0032E3F8B2